MNLITENELTEILGDYEFSNDLVVELLDMVCNKEPLPKIIEFLMLEECEIKLLREQIERIHRIMKEEKKQDEKKIQKTYKK